MSLLKVVRSLDGYSFQVIWTTHCTCLYLRKNMHTAIQPHICTMALQFYGLPTAPATAMLPMHEILGGVCVRRLADSSPCCTCWPIIPMWSSHMSRNVIIYVLSARGPEGVG